MAASTKILVVALDSRWILVILVYQEMPHMMPKAGLSPHKTWSKNVHRLDLIAKTAMVAPVGNALTIE